METIKLNLLIEDDNVKLTLSNGQKEGLFPIGPFFIHSLPEYIVEPTDGKFYGFVYGENNFSYTTKYKMGWKIMKELHEILDRLNEKLGDEGYDITVELSFENEDGTLDMDAIIDEAVYNANKEA